MARRNTNQNNYNQYYGQYNNQYYNQNGQYNNQNYNNNRQQNVRNNQKQGGKFFNNQYFVPDNAIPEPVEPKKKKNKKKLNFNMDQLKLITIILFVILSIVLIITIKVLTSNNDDEEIIENPPIEYQDTRTVGSSIYGYVTIPGDWLKFQNETQSGSLQYSDKDGIYVLTMDIVKTGEISVNDYVAVLTKSLQSNGVSNIQSATEKLGDYESIKITGFNAKKNVWIALWCFDAQDNKVHWIGVEGPDQASEYFNIPSTFKLTK